jgi:hypothetical protein
MKNSYNNDAVNFFTLVRSFAKEVWEHPVLQKPRIAAALLLVMVFAGYFIESIANIASLGQGWLPLFASAILMGFSAKFLPFDHPVRVFFRGLWSKA